MEDAEDAVDGESGEDGDGGVTPLSVFTDSVVAGDTSTVFNFVLFFALSMDAGGTPV